jgi:hypothetical protein
MNLADQKFDNYAQWVSRASLYLTSHERYNNTEHGVTGWRGEHFVALCFDTKGRRCRNGADMMRARDEGCFPVRYIWPDQYEKDVFELLLHGFNDARAA